MAKQQTKTKLRKRCQRCKGKGWRFLITGPMVLDGGQATPGGKAKFDCRSCGGTGRVPNV